MTIDQNTLVVLIDADDIKFAFSEWPDSICLAACLSRSGECHFIFFRRDEREDIADRVLDLLNLDEHDVCFAPEVPGFASREIRYSDEQRLMALIASEEENLSEAVDYAVNYTYAIEEGLDPAVVIGLPLKRRKNAAVAGAAGRTHDPDAGPNTPRQRELSPLLPDFLRKAAAQSRRPRFSTVRNGGNSSFSALSRAPAAVAEAP